MIRNRKIWFLFVAFAMIFALAGTTSVCTDELTSLSDTKNVVTVSTVDEFLAAIGPNVEILLAPGDYTLSQARYYGRGGSEFYHWEYVYDGYELVITDTVNLTICGDNWNTATICTEPRYANVLRFDHCANTTISDLTVGHTIEPGSCSGGVLYFADCDGVEVLSSKLYGCGIRGLDLLRTRNAHMDCSDIYDCSEGAVYIYGCENVLVENSKFYDCQFYFSLFEVSSSDNVALINSEIFNNRSEYEGNLFSVSGPNAYFGGLDVHDNIVNTMFFCPNSPVTLEKSRFMDTGYYWYEGYCPVSSEGTELTEAELSNMALRIVKWEPKEAEQLVVSEAEDGKIHVTNVDEFLAAIGSDVTIYLEPGIYDLSHAANYGGYGNAYYYWNDTYDGAELLIRGVSNLTIEGAGADLVSIVAVPRYANVLGFENSSGIILRNFTAGHTEAPDSCSGGVLWFSGVNKVNVEGCKLYGCGILGVWAMNCRNFYVLNTEIYECSSGAAWFYGCTNVSLDGCNVHDNGGMNYYADFRCTDVLVDGTPVSDMPFGD